MSTKRGMVNAYSCPVCDSVWGVVQLDDGVTPMFVGCRATEGCEGRSVSQGYPSGPVPQFIIDKVHHEWFRSTPGEELLDLRELTDAGRKILAAGVVQ